MKKGVLLRLGILALVAAAGFVLLVWCLSRSNLIDAETFALIQGGMSEREVVEVVGVPGSSDSILLWPNRKLFDVEAVSFGGNIFGGIKEWQTLDGRAIVVAFDENGKVSTVMRFRVDENLLDKIRRRLRL